MSELRLEDWLPAGVPVRIKGMLLSEYGADDLALLDQDILEIELPNELRIEVGWFPENDPTGHFLVQIFRKGQLTPAEPAREAKSPPEVASLIADLVRKYAARPAPAASR
jgi:hypothetical protein